MATVSRRFRSAAHPGDLDGVPAAPLPFPLLRWFALLSAAAIMVVLGGGALFLNRFVAQATLQQSADGLTQRVNSLIAVEGAARFFLPEGRADPDDFGNLLAHLASLPGALRTNAYGTDGTVLWSTDAALVRRRFTDNRELDAALAGAAVVATGVIGQTSGKAEHAGLLQPGDIYVENYLPVWSGPPGVGRPIGAIEVYRKPLRLLDAIERLEQEVWYSVFAVGGLLYAALFAIVARAEGLMRRQQASLLAAEKLATVGEMASAVAHGLRNPLASIRSTAELGLEAEDAKEVRERHAEVMREADRLEGWIAQFLTAARSEGAEPPVADARALIADCVAQFRPVLDRHGTALELTVPDELPPVHFCGMMLRHVLNCVLTNAVEAMGDGGRLSIVAAGAGSLVTIEIGDTGAGMSAEEVDMALAPFVTTKRAGLGLGLPLARETLERHGGSLHLTSRPGAGTTVRLTIPVVPSWPDIGHA